MNTTQKNAATALDRLSELSLEELSAVAAGKYDDVNLVCMPDGISGPSAFRQTLGSIWSKLNGWVGGSSGQDDQAGGSGGLRA